MNRYYVYVSYYDHPGSDYGRVYIEARDPAAAIARARALYGRLLVNESVFLA